MIMKKNYYFQKKDKSVEIFTMTDSNNYNSRETMLIIIKDPLVFLEEIKEGRTSIQEAKNIQKEFNEQLNFIRRGNKNQEKRQALNNINNLYNARDMANLLKIMVQ